MRCSWDVALLPVLLLSLKATPGLTQSAAAQPPDTLSASEAEANPAAIWHLKCSCASKVGGGA